MDPTAIHPLALWDAPFLPGPDGDGGSPLAVAGSLPYLARRQLAAQLAAAVAFFLEQGFYPERSLMRSACFSGGREGVVLRFSRFPRWRLDNPRLSRALAWRRRAERLPWLVLVPFLKALVPELSSRWETPEPGTDFWSFPRHCLTELTAKDRGGKTLDHPGGWGRFLWARHFQLPAEGGLFRVDDPGLAGRLAAVGEAVVGELSEEQVAPIQAQGLAAGLSPLVITTLNVPEVQPLPLAGEPAFWCLLKAAGEGQAAEVLSGAMTGESAALGVTLAHAVAGSWGGGETRPLLFRRALSSGAQKLATALERSGLGLSPQEAEAVGGAGACDELARLQLVTFRFGRWFWPGARRVDVEALEPFRDRLPDGPLRWGLAAAGGGSAAPLLEWCEAELDRGRPSSVLGLWPFASVLSSFRDFVTEAALAAGWLTLGEPWLRDCSPPRRELFGVWWALAAGEAEGVFEVAEALEGLRGALPARLEARRLVLLATLAERQGNGSRARKLGQEALALPGLDPELAAEAAYLAGEDLLERYLVESGLPASCRQRALHLAGVQRIRDGDPRRAEALLRQALGVGAGGNPLLLGELLADAGAVAMLRDKPMEAERLFAAAEFWLSLAGSRRGLKLTAFNRAVLANDRLQWRKAQELLAKVASAGDTTALDEAFLAIEQARSFLARGKLAEASTLAARLESLVSALPENPNLRQGVAVVQGHLALLAGKLAQAEALARHAEPSEKELFLSVLASRDGTVPAQSLPARWGLAATGRLLALARTNAQSLPQAVEELLARGEGEGALAVARAVLLAPFWGLDVMPSIRPFFPRLKARLRSANLDGWVELVEKRYGRDWAEILGVVSRLLSEGTALWNSRAWEDLARSLGLSSLAVTWQGKELVKVGLPETGWSEGVGPFHVKLPGSWDEEVLAVLRLVLERAPVPVAEAPLDHCGLSGTSARIAALRQDVVRYAPLPLTVLILGEPGTGKERVARALHRLSGRRGAFVAVNCAGLPENLLEAELFGVVRGAFTGADRDRPGLVEEAEGGTLFLDEVGELPLSMQAKLLRLLQEREVRRVGATRTRKVDVRIVAATNRDLKRAVGEGAFRRDLYDRLAMVTIAVPPLRERLEDLPILVAELVESFAAQFGLGPVAVLPEFVARLAACPWPGNVRELESVVVQALLRCPRGEPLGAWCLPQDLAGEKGAEGPLPPFRVAERAFVRDYVSRLLAETGGNRSRAARLAKITRPTLYKLLREAELGSGKTSS